MTTEFLTIKEAAERYQKAEITIRRLVRGIIHESTHTDRTHIRPDPSEVKKLKSKKKPFSYAVSADLLERAYKKEQGREVSVSTEQEKVPYVKLLERMNESMQNQLTVKDDQIRALNQTLDELSERQRETNVLMKGLQEQFLLASGDKKEQGKKWWKVW
jgi:exonuclease VII large subunit